MTCAQNIAWMRRNQTNQQQQQKGQTLNQDFSKEDIWIAKKHMQRCSMSRIKKTKHAKRWAACGTTGTHPLLVEM